MWKRILIFIGLKIAELIGLCLFISAICTIFYLIDHYSLVKILCQIAFSIIGICLIIGLGISNWEKAKKLEQKWFSKKPPKGKGST